MQKKITKKVAAKKVTKKSTEAFKKSQGTKAKTKNSHIGEFKFGGTYYPKVEATAPLIIEVTKEDIFNAKRENPNACAIACSVRRTYGDVHVGRSRAMILRAVKGKIFAFWYVLAKKAQKSVAALDNKGAFPAGTYKLLPPSPSQRLEAKRGDKRDRTSKKIVKRKKTIRQHIRHATPAVF